MQTRRTLLTRLTQVGLLTAGSQFVVGCDRLPGQAARMPRIGYVANQNSAGASDPVANAATQALVDGLGDYGYIPGQNLQMESRFPTDDRQNAEMISDLLHLGVDLLVTGGTAATLSANHATSTVPILGIYVGDLVATGLVQSLARPGGNVTGISNGAQEIVGKWLDLLLKFEPTHRRIGYLYNPANASHVTVIEQFITMAAASGVETVRAPVPTLTDLDVVFETAVSSGAEAFIWVSFLGVEGDTRVAALASSHHLVTVGAVTSYPMAGGLMSYSADLIAVWRRGGFYVDRILKGAKPADLPVELPTAYDMVVNQATAKALGVTIPDEVAQQVTSWI
jgi:putative ABC transport system substrate-binding protein